MTNNTSWGQCRLDRRSWWEVSGEGVIIKGRVLGREVQSLLPTQAFFLFSALKEVFQTGPKAQWMHGSLPLVVNHLWFIMTVMSRWRKKNLRGFPILFCVHLLSRVPLVVTPWMVDSGLPCLSLSSRVCSSSCPLSQWCHLTISSSATHFSSCPQSFPASGSFNSESALRIRWPQFWSLSFSICPSNEYSGLISFRIDRLDLLAVQGTLKSLLQHHSSKASILWHSGFFILFIRSTKIPVSP